MLSDGSTTVATIKRIRNICKLLLATWHANANVITILYRRCGIHSTKYRMVVWITQNNKNKRSERVKRRAEKCLRDRRCPSESISVRKRSSIWLPTIYIYYIYSHSHSHRSRMLDQTILVQTQSHERKTWFLKRKQTVLVHCWYKSILRSK